MSLRLAFAVCLTVLACTSPTAVSRDAERLIQTEALTFALVPDPSGRLLAQIPYVFTNSTGSTVYLENCNGGFGLHLERQDAGAWQTAWAPTIQTCLSSPIVIENNASFHDTLYAYGANPGSNSSPTWDRENPSGLYRIVWDDAVSPYPGPTIAFERRISNRFVLTK